MSNEEFTDIQEQEPEEGQYCTMRVVSYFKGWYLPSCKSWSWLMDEASTPRSHVDAWKPEEEKGVKQYEYLPRQPDV